MLMRVQLRWVGYVQWMSDNRMTKQILYSELFSSARRRGGQRKRYRDTLKQTLKLTGINTETWHELVENRTAWRQAVKKRVRFVEAERLKTRADKRQKRKSRGTGHKNPSKSCKCRLCISDIACKSRIGLYSHSRTHPQQQHWHHQNRWVRFHWSISWKPLRACKL